MLDLRGVKWLEIAASYLVFASVFTIGFLCQQALTAGARPEPRWLLSAVPLAVAGGCYWVRFVLLRRNGGSDGSGM